MLIAKISLIALAAQAAPLLPPLPDWDSLTPLAFRQVPVVTPPMTRFVAEEITSGRCKLPMPPDRHYVVRVDLAVLVSPEGEVKGIVPHAIDCPTVEQYGAGLLIGFARGNVSVVPGAKANSWYRTTIAFDWTE